MVWQRSSGVYQIENLRALKFSSRKEYNRAVDLFWNDPDLKGIPRDTPDKMTHIVPMEAVELLRKKGLDFKLIPLKSKDCYIIVRP